MTEIQYTTLLIGLAIAVGANITAVLVALLINNARLSDVRDALRAEIGSVRSEIRAKIAESRESVLTHMAAYQMDVISKIAELGNRITRLER